MIIAWVNITITGYTGGPFPLVALSEDYGIVLVGTEFCRFMLGDLIWVRWDKDD